MTHIPTSDSLYSVAILIDELKHEDGQRRLESMRSLTTIAKALGPQRTTDELLLFLNESLDDEDEVLLAMAEELGKFVPLVGGKEFLPRLLLPLESLATVEEGAVRSMAIKSLTIVSKEMPDADLQEHFVQLLRRLVQRDWFTSRISACALFEIVYPRVPDATKAELRGQFGVLCRDDTPMVRRAATASLATFSKVVDKDHAVAELLPLFSALAEDEQDSVKLLAVAAAVSFAEIVRGDAASTATVLETSLRLAADKSWRVRWASANSFEGLCAVLGADPAAKTRLVEAFVGLLQDQEAEVRTIAACNVSAVAVLFDPAMAVESFLPPVRSLATDGSKHVRESLAGVIMGLAHVFGKEKTIGLLLPLFLDLLQDSSPDVRLAIVAKLESVDKVIGIDLLSQSLLPALRELAQDSKWRVRSQVIDHIPSLAEQLGQEYFDANLADQAISWLSDDVYSIRELAAKNLRRLSEIFGAEWATKNVVPRVLEQVSHEQYLCRMTVLHSVEELNHVLSPDTVEASLVPAVLILAKDPVANVRFNVAKTLGRVGPKLSSSSAGKIKETLLSLSKDPDSDCKYYAAQALSAMG